MQLLCAADAVSDCCKCSSRLLHMQFPSVANATCYKKAKICIVADAVSDCCKCSFRFLHMQFPSVATAMLQLQFLVRLSPLPLSRAPSHADSDAATPKSEPGWLLYAAAQRRYSLHVRYIVAWSLTFSPNRRPHQPITS